MALEKMVGQSSGKNPYLAKSGVGLVWYRMQSTVGYDMSITSVEHLVQNSKSCDSLLTGSP